MNQNYLLKSMKVWENFFTRNIKANVRPIASNDIVSPVDGKILYYGVVNEKNKTLEQIKGVKYSLRDFMGSDSPIFDVIKKEKEIKSDRLLYYCIIYLAPGDYHGYHSPADCTIDERRHFSGHLFSVSPFAVQRIQGLFALNERVVLTGKWKYGFFAFVPIGAYNVGSIKLKNEPDFSTNLPSQLISQYEKKIYNPALDLKKGENIGFFNLGSTVVFLFEGPPLVFTKKPFEKVKMGEEICKMLTEEEIKTHIEELKVRRKKY